MAQYPKVPSYTKAQLNKAGKDLVLNESLESAQNILREWRACHAYPINTFQATLRLKLRKFNLEQNALIAQRLKRMPTIVDKLKRYPTMNLAQMQDIGGLRVVLDSMSEVRKVQQSYKVKSGFSRFEHSLVGEKDYIEKPRSEDGYRSLHLIYSYKNRVAPEYKGLLLEIQIRTKLQHNWATAVETMGIYLNQPLKSRLGKKEWIDFFALISSAFAYIEKQPLVPRFANLSKEETFKQVIAIEKKLGVLDKLAAFATVSNIIAKKRNSGFYHLIILNTDTKTIELFSYAKKKFEDAKFAYAKAEERAIRGEKIEPVLVAVGAVGTVQRAYPNFFLDTTEFVQRVKTIIDSVA